MQAHRQQRSLFIRNMIAFGLLFLVLGVIISQILQQSLYKDVDEKLQLAITNEHFIRSEVQRNLSEGDFRNLNNPPNSFQTELMVWSAKGKLLNEQQLGNRYDDLKNITFNKTDSDQINSIQVKNSYDQQMSFRSVIKKIKLDGTTYYIQLVSNTNQLENTVQFFQKVIISCMIVFWLISIVLSYYLARKNMAPIMVAWQKQQEFVENSSHELRTPLSIVQTKLEKLLTTPNHTILDEAESIALALSETRRLRRLTSDLLMLARADNNEVHVNMTSTAIAPYLEKLCEPYSEIAASQGKKFVLKIETTKQLHFDQTLMTQLLIILFDNALKYTREGDEITISVTDTAKQWTLTVSDTGIGIAPEHAERLFERFYREDKARQRESGGHGLGLAIAQSIVTLHQGTIKAVANPSGGTCFMMIFARK
ncbi:hypothetical protein BFR40_05845 [Brochothrix thermosphacta]|uniref:sensor histidine kinase n=1 Tax=Brochothrix thermosphacta TaxID=2756 RepID=UPI00083FDA60|nr:ATP-binding protein [Brochothrix thermosphacta]ODJ52379.1 hypothetical protein BFR40_05845 [Brochothrix thermosphacta]